MTDALAEPDLATLRAFDGPRDIDTPGEAARAVRPLLEQWGEVHLRDRPRSALMLSGGVDSLLMAATYGAQGFNPLCVTVAIPGTPDAVGAAAAAAHLGLEHHLIDARSVVALWHSVSDALEADELWEITAGIPLVAVYRFLAERKVTGPVLSGGRADAVFLGGWSPEGDLRNEQRRRATATFEFQIPDFYERLVGEAGAKRYLQPYSTQAMWDVAGRLTKNALYVHREGATYDKAALREAAVRLGVPENLVWTVKDPLQRSSGLMELLADEARTWMSNRPLATAYSNPREEPADQALARLWLAVRSRVGIKE
ncbi:MAG: asparagine synthase-related protein [Pseudonocardiaceae bacterium]